MTVATIVSRLVVALLAIATMVLAVQDGGGRALASLTGAVLAFVAVVMLAGAFRALTDRRPLAAPVEAAALVAVVVLVAATAIVREAVALGRAEPVGIEWWILLAAVLAVWVLVVEHRRLRPTWIPTAMAVAVAVAGVLVVVAVLTSGTWSLSAGLAYIGLAALLAGVAAAIVWGLDRVLAARVTPAARTREPMGVAA